MGRLLQPLDRLPRYTGGLIVFFTHGAFAYNGAFAFYLPAVGFLAGLLPNMQ